MGGGFSERESFVGELSQLNMYDHVLSSFVIAELANNTNYRPDSPCHPRCMISHGNVLKWTEVVGHTYGAVETRTDSRCLGTFVRTDLRTEYQEKSNVLGVIVE